MVLDKDKYHVHINKFNLLGFLREGTGEQVLIRDIQYIGEVKNEYLSFDYFGLPPSIIKLLSVSNTALQKDPQTGNALAKSVPKQDQDMFKHFTAFMANNKTYLLPMDSKEFEKSLITEELLHHVMHGRQRAILKYDFSVMEEDGDRLFKNVEEIAALKQDQHNETNFVT